MGEVRNILVAADLGTTSMTIRHGIFEGSTTSNERRVIAKSRAVTGWPGASLNYTNGESCVPTELVYDLNTRAVSRWGFKAKEYIDDPRQFDVNPSELFTVDKIKLLLLDPSEAAAEAITPAVTAEVYQEKTQEILDQLGKTPFDVFEDLLVAVFDYVFKDIRKVREHNLLFPQTPGSIELCLAFPSGWPEYVHSRVARSGFKAAMKAGIANGLDHWQFAMENVYTVSETLCGSKEWLRNQVARSIWSDNVERPLRNIEELEIGDKFLPIDIGGGTGCMTVLQLVSKSPLRVNQITRTQSLAICGAAVDGRFRQWLLGHLLESEYTGDDYANLINRICRKFEDKKKKCGDSRGAAWFYDVTGLKESSEKRFDKSGLRISFKTIEEICFDPVLNELEEAIENIFSLHSDIKAIVFLGQFGAHSPYLRKRMETSQFHNKHTVQLRYGDIDGKQSVVNGAYSERLDITDRFGTRLEAISNYGILMSLNWNLPWVKKLFPDARKSKHAIFERWPDRTNCLKVVRWDVPMGTCIDNGFSTHSQETTKDRLLEQLFKKGEAIEFTEYIVVSREPLLPPASDGFRYTLWTKEHETGWITKANQRIKVTKKPVLWNITMARKQDANGGFTVPIDPRHLPVKQLKRSRPKLVKFLLDFEITEMQLNCWIEVQIGVAPYYRQLARDMSLTQAEIRSGPSISQGLREDQQMTYPTAPLGRYIEEGEADQNLGSVQGQGSSPLGNVEDDSTDQEEPYVSAQSSLDIHGNEVPRNLQSLDHTESAQETFRYELRDKKEDSPATVQGEDLPAGFEDESWSPYLKPIEEPSQDVSVEESTPLARARYKMQQTQKVRASEVSLSGDVYAHPSSPPGSGLGSDNTYQKPYDNRTTMINQTKSKIPVKRKRLSNAGQTSVVERERKNARKGKQKARDELRNHLVSAPGSPVLEPRQINIPSEDLVRAPPQVPETHSVSSQPMKAAEHGSVRAGFTSINIGPGDSSRASASDFQTARMRGDRRAIRGGRSRIIRHHRVRDR
ncbi:hypothetical protein BP6252_08356 [Coleophoma cylindrospora]|uniref:Uncharacterized protein n=1 Tax=Coleophoma cylindrospora TaxID=1849047 RepID=A0A3D8R5Q6_9HELO|nr:hypothetical protein BP6252_08356 [Coleophoma cylindrospora]